jgi:cytochrome c553
MQLHSQRFQAALKTASLTLIALSIIGGITAFSPSILAAPQETAPADKAGQAFFQQKVQPVLATHCYDCHSASTRSAGGLRVDDLRSLLQGGKTGPAVVPGKPDDSLLLQRIVSTDEKKRMPKGDDPLADADVANVRAWIAGGAQWADAAPGSAASSPATVQKIAASATRIPYPRPATPEQLAFFEKNVRPILVNRCYNCHSQDFKEAGGLRVDVGIAIFKGGKDGPVILPGHPEKSLLIERVKSTDLKKRMPQESEEALPANEIAILESWIKDGAAWPDETVKLPPTPERLVKLYPRLRAEWWSWQPLTNPTAPQIANDKWSTSNIDRFLLANLSEKKLAPVADADPDTLLRRVRYDLTGLPPTPEEIQAFRKDHSQKAYSALVDKLLASPQFGERWGRHWLDVARYAESSGPSRNMPYPNAWRYRDYVIDAFNRDLPLNRFLAEQIAGDLIPAATPADRDRLLVATGYLALGPKDVNQRFSARFKMDNVDDQIDTVTRSTMALTVSCARCHDHKFDPIPTTDYYAIAGIFTSTQDNSGLSSRMGGASLDYYDPKHLGYMSSSAHAQTPPKDQLEKLKAEFAVAKKANDELTVQAAKELKENATPPVLSDAEKKRRTEIRRRFVELRENIALLDDLGELGYGVHSVGEGEAADTAVRVRGVEEKHGPVVPRGFLSLVSLPNTPKIPDGHSGRLELAEWITNPRNPLTSRVYVNRVWQHLFGAGIVSTVDNFGSMGDKPSNPELLDYLAQNFIQNGWSTKKLVREIVLTHAYRLGSSIPDGYKDIDPANRLVWRHSPRRLETEEIRDSILASAGTLDPGHPQGSSSMALRMIEIRDDGPVVDSVLQAADRNHYRSVYLPLLRDETPRALTAFDPVSQTLVTGRRDETTVPSQALFMLNSPFVREQSLRLAGQLLSGHASDSERIRVAFQRIVGRDPSPTDIRDVRAFLAGYASTWSNSRSGAAAAHVERTATDQKAYSLTDGIVREDGLTQDDAVDNLADNPHDPAPEAATAKAAAWEAFIQALYGSAAFQFVR